MTPEELATLKPEFSLDEKFTNGHVIDWGPIDYQTMWWMRELRKHLGQPIYLIRGAHPNRPEAVDFTCPGVGLGQVFHGLTRLPGMSWGVYSGNSGHLDSREYGDGLPARWMAVKRDERVLLQTRGLEELIYNESGQWLYLLWNHPRSFEALKLVIELAEMS